VLYLKLVVFDMDGTLLDGRVIFKIAERWDFKNKLLEIMNSDRVDYKQSEEIAQLLRGISVKDIISVIEKIPLTLGSEDTIKKLKKKNWILGIMSDSYTLATRMLMKKLNMDFQVANELDEKNGVLTGKVTMPLGWSDSDCRCQRSVCKSHYLDYYAERYDIPLSETVAIGDNTSDLCVLKKAGFAIAFNPKNELLIEEADITITKPDMREILKYIN